MLGAKQCSMMMIWAALTAFGSSEVRADAGYAMGAGTLTCAEFGRRYKDASSPDTMETIFFSWAQGYMTALNYLLLQNINRERDLGAVPVETQEAKIRQYCDAHPLADYADAVFELFQQFPLSSELDQPKKAP